MATGSSHATFRFKIILVVLFITLLLTASFSLIASHAYASTWFTIFDGGIFSNQGITNEKIPATVTGLNSETIQHPDFGVGSPEFGVLLSSNGSINSTIDGGDGESTTEPYIKNIGITVPGLDIDSLAQDITSEIPGSICSTFLYTGTPLKPSSVTKVSPSCLNTGITGMPASGYRLYSRGVVVLVVVGSPTTPININKNMVPQDPGMRIMLITNSPIIISDAVVNIKMSLISTRTEADALDVGNSTTTLNLEGPLMVSNSVTLDRSTVGPEPGVIIRYNPVYASALSDTLYLIGPQSKNYRGLYTSKTGWRYE